MSNLIRWQWEGYPRNHRSRVNLLLHIVFVPLFLAGNVGLVVAVASWSPPGILAATVTMTLAFAMQGLGHTREAVPAEPFKGPVNAVARILCEQWITFPRFVLSSGWFRALRAATR